MAKTLLLDVMSTLIYDPFYVEMPAFFGMTLGQLLECKHPNAWQRFELGEIDEQSFLDSFFRDGRSYDQAAFKAHVTSAYRWLDGMRELTLELAARGTALHALSNYPSWYQQIEQRTQLAETVPWSFVSCHMGVRKPDSEAFLLPARTLGLKPEECLLVDDQERNCRAAQALGMDAIRFTDAESLRQELRARDLLDA
ncbi:MAG: HAD superfamily hydrolase (TIGR01509 family) [Planctomycetota bacterium]|jgi:HAD superfamily hydrolase (TIGR01509 family)